MRLREFINTEDVYKCVEQEIKTWIENSYPGLSIEFEPHLEVVQTDSKVRFSKRRVRKIIEVVNVKIGDVMESHAEWIYIAERLDCIYLKHPEFDMEVESMEDIKQSTQFLEYLNELVIRGT